MLFILEGHSTASLPNQAPSFATTPPSPCCSPYGMSATQKGRHTGGQPDRQRSRPGPNEDAKQSHVGSLFYSFCDYLSFLSFKLNRYNTSSNAHVLARVKNEWHLSFDVLKLHFIYWTPVDAASKRSKFGDFCLEMF